MSWNLNHHHYIHLDPDSAGLLRAINGKLDSVLSNQETIMATLDQVAQDMTDESTQIDGLSTFIAGLQQQISDALAGTTLPPAVQAKVDSIFSQAEANKAKLVTALNAGTPAAPASPTPPT